MKINIVDDNITLFINKSLIDFDIHIKEELENFIKKQVLKLKKKGYKISGFYKVMVYQNDSYGLIFDMKKEDELDFFPDLVDLKLVIFYDSDIYFAVNDYFLVKDYENIRVGNYWYVNTKLLKDSDIYKLVEFSKVVYGPYLNKLF